MSTPRPSTSRSTPGQRSRGRVEPVRPSTVSNGSRPRPNLSLKTGSASSKTADDLNARGASQFRSLLYTSRSHGGESPFRHTGPALPTGKDDESASSGSASPRPGPLRMEHFEDVGHFISTLHKILPKEEELKASVTSLQLMVEAWEADDKAGKISAEEAAKRNARIGQDAEKLKSFFMTQGAESVAPDSKSDTTLALENVIATQAPNLNAIVGEMEELIHTIEIEERTQSSLLEEMEHLTMVLSDIMEEQEDEDRLQRDVRQDKEVQQKEFTESGAQTEWGFGFGDGKHQKLGWNPTESSGRGKLLFDVDSDSGADSGLDSGQVSEEEEEAPAKLTKLPSARDVWGKKKKTQPIKKEGRKTDEQPFKLPKRWRSSLHLSFGQSGSVRLMPLRVVLEDLPRIYEEKYQADHDDDAAHIKRQSLPDFVYDFYLSRHGLKSLAANHILSLTATLKKYYQRNARLRNFARLLGLSEPYSKDALHSFLMAFHFLVRHDIDETFGDGMYFLPTSVVADAVRRAVDDTALASRINSKIGELEMKSGGQVIVDMDEALQMMLEEMSSQDEILDAKLLDLFKRGDKNGDGVLTYEEFSSLLSQAAPGLTERQMTRMFRESLGTSSADSIDTAKFTRVCKTYGILSTRETGVFGRYRGHGGHNGTFADLEDKVLQLVFDFSINDKLSALYRDEDMRRNLLEVKHRVESRDDLSDAWRTYEKLADKLRSYSMKRHLVGGAAAVRAVVADKHADAQGEGTGEQPSLVENVTGKLRSTSRTSEGKQDMSVRFADLPENDL